MSEEIKKKKKRNKRKKVIKNKKRRVIVANAKAYFSRGQKSNHLQLGQHQQNLPQYTRTVYVNNPTPNLNAVGPDQSELINQVLHNNNFIKKNNLLLQNNDLNNTVWEDSKEKEKISHPLDDAKIAFTERGGTVHTNKTNTILRIPHIKTKMKKSKFVDVTSQDKENDLNDMVHHEPVRLQHDNDLNDVLSRPDAEFQDINDQRELESHNVPDIIQQVKPQKTKRFFNKSDAQILKERKAREAQEDLLIEKEMHQQAIIADHDDDLKSTRHERHKKHHLFKNTV